MLIIVNPTAEGIDPYAGFTLLAVLCMAARDLVTRSISAQVPSTLVAIAGALGLACFSGGLAWAQNDEWAVMGLREWACLAGATLTGSCGFFSSVLLMRIGSVSFVSARTPEHLALLAVSRPV